MHPLARLRRSMRAALRRRYGYATLRTLRRGLRAALSEHRAREIGAATYSTATQELTEAYARALERLRKRWPQLPFDDPRARP